MILLSKILNFKVFFKKPSTGFNSIKSLKVTPSQKQIIEIEKAAKFDIQQDPKLKQFEQKDEIDEQVEQAEFEQLLNDQKEEEIDFIESNWSDMANYIYTPYSPKLLNLTLTDQVNKKLRMIENLYKFDIQNLSQVKIQNLNESELRNQRNNNYFKPNNSFPKTFSPSLSSMDLINLKLFKELLEKNNIQLIKQIYANHGFQNFFLEKYLVDKIFDLVVDSHYQNHFLLNLIEFHKVGSFRLFWSEKIQKIFQNIHNFDELNKLAFFWKIQSLFQSKHKYISFNIVEHELTKLSFEQFNQQKSQKSLRLIYSSVLGKEALQKLITYSFEKYSHSFELFLKFWGIFNLLMGRLSGLNILSCNDPKNLTTFFILFKNNLKNYQEIITEAIPEALIQTNNKILIEIYRVHALAWIKSKEQYKPFPKMIFNVANSSNIGHFGPFDDFINQKVQLGGSLKIFCQTSSQNFKKKIETSIKISKDDQNVTQTPKSLLETDMIQHLIKGNYSITLKYFLIAYSQRLNDKIINQIKNIQKQANQKIFTDQNTKALYIFKQINHKYFNLFVPVSFQKQFLEDEVKEEQVENKYQTSNQFFVKENAVKEKRKQQKKNYEKQDDFNQFYQNREHKQRIYHKEKRFKDDSSLFSKKNYKKFSTQKDSYSEYREIVKQLSKQNTAEIGFTIQMNQNISISTFKQEVQKKSKQMKQNDLKTLFQMNNLPFVGTGLNLMKYLFLKKPDWQTPKLQSQLKNKLKVSFVSEIGGLQKDYSQYIEKCRFNFPLDQKVYLSLLEDQSNKFFRGSFKTIVAHMIAHQKHLSDEQVRLICQICKQHRMGITLLQIYNLMIQNKIQISKKAIYDLCQTLQVFKNINEDIFKMTRNYCEKIEMDFEIKMMASYVKSLLIDKQDQKLSEFCDFLKNELKPKSYKIKSDLTAQENIKQEKDYKEFQKQQYKKILKEIIHTVVSNLQKQLPAFVSLLFNQYKKFQTKLEAEDIAISLIVYCNQVEQFLQILKSLREQPQKVTLLTYEYALKALTLNIKNLESHSEQIFNVTFFFHKFMLNQDIINKSLQVFKVLSNANIFTRFLDYILRHNPQINEETKEKMFSVMKSIDDDVAKDIISKRLDFIFNSNRQKEREEFKKVQILEEQKVKLIQNISKSSSNQTHLLKDSLIANSETQEKEDKKKQKKNKTDEKQKILDKKTKHKEEQSKIKAQKKMEKQLKKEVQTTAKFGNNVMMQKEGVLKKSSLKKMYRSKSLDTFEQLFAQREEIVEDEASKIVKGVKLVKGVKEVKGKQVSPKDANNKRKSLK